MSAAVKTGTFSRDAAGASFPVSALTGSSPNGPIVAFSIFAEQYDVPQMDILIQLAPNAGGSHGYPGDPQTDEVYTTDDPPEPTGIYHIATNVGFAYIPSAEFPNRWYGGSGYIDLPNGLTDIAVVSNYNHPIFVQLTLTYKDPSVPGDWLNPGPADPTDVIHDETDSVESPGDKDETFSWTAPVDPLVGTIIQRSDNDGPDVVVAIKEPGVGTHVDTVVPGITYVYKVYYYYVDGSGISSPYIVPPITPGGATPLITMTMGGEFEFGGAPSIGMIVNPSGIYGLIPNLTHDTLYERIPTITSINVKIPDPFAKLGFLPED